MKQQIKIQEKISWRFFSSLEFCVRKTALMLSFFFFQSIAMLNHFITSSLNLSSANLLGTAVDALFQNGYNNCVGRLPLEKLYASNCLHARNEFDGKFIGAFVHFRSSNDFRGCEKSWNWYYKPIHRLIVAFQLCMAALKVDQDTSSTYSQKCISLVNL